MTREEIIKIIDGKSSLVEKYNHEEYILWENEKPVELTITKQNLAEILARACHLDMISVVRSVSGRYFVTEEEPNGCTLAIEFPMKWIYELDSLPYSHLLRAVRDELNKIEKDIGLCLAGFEIGKESFYGIMEYPFIPQSSE